MAIKNHNRPNSRKQEPSAPLPGQPAAGTPEKPQPRPETVTPPPVRTPIAARPAPQKPAAPAPEPEPEHEQIIFDRRIYMPEYVEPNNPEKEFLNACIYNTIHIQLPEAAEGIRISEEFRSLMLSVEFTRHDDTRPGTFVPVPGEHISMRQMQQAEVTEPRFRVIPDAPQHRGGNPPDTGVLEFSFRISCFFEGINGEPVSSGSFRMALLFGYSGNETQTIDIAVPEEQEQHETIKNRVVNFFTKKPANENGSRKNRKQFLQSDRRDRVDPLILYDSSLTVKIGDTVYYPRIHCFSPRYLHLTCPICRGSLDNLGIPGILLYSKDNRMVRTTSDAILKYLRSFTVNDPFFEQVKYATETAYRTIHRVRHHENAPDIQVIPSEIGSDENIGYIRIPLGKYEVIRHRDSSGETVSVPRIRPFRSSESDALKAIFDRINQHIMRQPAEPEPQELKDKFYLLNAGMSYSDQNRFIHNDMIYQLCEHCWNPLPPRFYQYAEILTILYYGNSNAGKTALICSLYNQLPPEQTRYNIVYFQPACEEEHNTVKSYQQRSEGLGQGVFPRGTDSYEVLPGLLTELPDSELGETGEHRCLFHNCDMPGVDSVANWNFFENFCYVYSLMEDPFRHAIGQNSRSSNIYSTIRSMVPEMSGWVCNMQLFLTKIDEFPYFLYRDITKLNAEWQAWFQNAYQQDAAHQFGAYGTAGANSAVYTAALLHILDQLRDDFYDKDAADVIHPDIMSVISSLLHYEEGLFSGTSYEAARGQIIPDLLKFSADTADRQTLRDVLLDYMIGLDSIRANYYQLRNLIRLLMRGARRNLQNNDASRFYFGFYAVSATGYSKIVTLAKELGLFHKPVSYQPEFVRESHRMLQCTTLEFCNAAQLTQNSGGLPCHAGSPDLIFDALPETHDPFRPSALDAYRSSGEPLSLLRICEEEVFAERPVFACESVAGLQKDLARVRAWENGAEPEQKQFARMLPLLEIYSAIGTEPGAQPDSP